jgi:sugar phosphate isomerase/epimerase
MRVAGAPGTHLTYCTNIHPGGSLQDITANLENHVVEVKRGICPDEPFGTGLWLPDPAARELESDSALAAFRETLKRLGLYVFTINGFPFDRFHGERVKENVYRPDWSEPARLEHTNRLAKILSRLLPEGVDGSISTVPVGFAERMDPSRVDLAVEHLTQHAAVLNRLKLETGKTIRLALEPEPFCYLESTDQALDFFSNRLFTEAKPVLREHLGVCLDACHLACGFEEPKTVLDAYRSAGVRINKLQISAGLSIRDFSTEAMTELSAFAEDVYFHQSAMKHGEAMSRFVDLGDAIEAAQKKSPDEMRVHFHVPIFLHALGRFSNTQEFLSSLLDLVQTNRACDHLEVETYTWDVLPEPYRQGPVEAAIARELDWALKRIG